MLLPKTYRIYCNLIDEYIQFRTQILIASSFLINKLIMEAYLQHKKIDKLQMIHIFRAKILALLKIRRFN